MPPLKKQSIKKDTPKEDSELEQIVEEAIQETEEQSLKEDFEEFNKGNEVVTNEQLFEKLNQVEILGLLNNKDILDNKKEIIKASKEDYDLSIHAITELHYLKKHYTKISVLVIMLVFVCGTGFGTLYESWLPYIDEIFELLKLTNNATSTVKG